MVDPRRTATAAGATLYLPLRPGTDLALLNGWLHLLVKMGRVDDGFIARHTEGWESMGEVLDAYPPARVSEITGLSVDDIIAGAKILADCPRWMSLWTMGLNQSARGTWNVNALCNLHLATGQIGRPGQRAVFVDRPAQRDGRPGGRLHERRPAGAAHRPSAAGPRGNRGALEAAPGSIRPRPGPPAIELFHAMERGEIKALWIIGSNPVVTLPNRARVRRGLERAEFVVVQDAYHPTETSRFAHVLLPGAVWAEADGTMTNSSRMVTLAPRAVPPPVDARPDWWLVSEVARRMGFGAAFPYRQRERDFRRNARQRQRAHRLRRARPQPRAAGAGRRVDVAAVAAGRRGGGQAPLRHAGRLPALPDGNGRARFWARPYLPNAEMPDDDYPFVLLTGRVRPPVAYPDKNG